jgi:peptide/nickel transport system substrate-binding protein
VALPRRRLDSGQAVGGPESIHLVASQGFFPPLRWLIGAFFPHIPVANTFALPTEYEMSPEKTVWTFTLRDGLEWHDGTPVTSEDCIASIERWGARDAMGSKLMDFVKELKVVDAKTFQIVLKEPYGLVLDSLGKPSAQIDSQIGSGPKLANVDRVEIVEMPDTQQQVNAIIAGEIDMIEQPPHDLLPILKKEKDVRLVSWNPFGHQFVFRMNHVVKPFDDPRIRMAAFLALRQEDYLKATIGDPEYYKVCTAAFICDTPNAFNAPGDLLIKPDFDKAKALLKEAGYDGTPVVVLQSTTLPVLTNTAPVMYTFQA